MIRSNINKISNKIIRHNNIKSIGIKSIITNKSIIIRLNSSSSSSNNNNITNVNSNTITNTRRELSTIPFVGNNNNNSNDNKRTIVSSSSSSSSSPSPLQSLKTLSENDINHFKNILNNSRNIEDDKVLTKLNLVGPRDDNW